jgi:hypothetical protein
MDIRRSKNIRSLTWPSHVHLRVPQLFKQLKKLRHARGSSGVSIQTPIPSSMNRLKSKILFLY